MYIAVEKTISKVELHNFCYFLLPLPVLRVENRVMKNLNCNPASIYIAEGAPSLKKFVRLLHGVMGLQSYCKRNLIGIIEITEHHRAAETPFSWW